MGNMDAPMPPMDADNGMNDPMGNPPMDAPEGGESPEMMPPAPGSDEPADADAGNEPDPMPGDPNALNAGMDGNPGEGGDITDKYNQLSPAQKNAADKYVDSMLNTESRVDYRKIIDETFSTIMNDIQKGTKRPEKKLGKDFEGVTDNPFVPNF